MPIVHRVSDPNEQIPSNADKLDSKDVLEVIDRLQHFLKEFNINLSVRLFNSLLRVNDPTEYLLNYAILTGRDYLDLAQKTKSKEYLRIISEMKLISTDKEINKRFSLFFGYQGTGKTTEAIKMLKDESKVMIMNEDVTPDALLYHYTLKDGKAEFTKTAFTRAMENGEAVLLDEINLAPFSTIRFIQGVLDNKEKIEVGNEVITIKDGFHVIGTMNEEVLGVENYMPEPLIDRAVTIKRFELTPDLIAKFGV